MHRSLADNTSTPIHGVASTPSFRHTRADFNLPSWIDQWLGSNLTLAEDRSGAMLSRQWIGDTRALVTVQVKDARALPDAAFLAAARGIYSHIASVSRSLDLPHPVRVWNFIPDIHAQSVDGDRYMTFNAARFEAMQGWLGKPLAARVPAASGVGHDGDALRVAALLSAVPGTPIDNPRQVPAYQYSPRFGRLPPCFARATRCGSALFISGTAAILGEETCFTQAFDRQLALTLGHLNTLAEVASMPTPFTFRDFRVYLPDRATVQVRSVQVRAALNLLCDAPVEFMRADLCRNDLLVEIEAFATTDGTTR